ncbi:hypothetical protein CAter282_2146 [Collimonas arenae]|uniref:Uncharacterized protein n=1 Tax=Collimonas arenae TaxID=279058 RepID=A0A127QK05_9BURK|nr:hypothetical protein CAter10_2339 [Collimonas arenae]AMP09902.1 hypothetical protein CAter282_2146 [Collimonas arenae]
MAIFTVRISAMKIHHSSRDSSYCATISHCKKIKEVRK